MAGFPLPAAPGTSSCTAIEDPQLTIAERIAVVRQRIADACVRVNRPAESVTIVAVSKFFSEAEVREAMSAGIADFGESRPQELERKASVIPGQKSGGDIRWHMIGNVQRNKARHVIQHADLLHSLDSIRLAEALSKRLQPGEHLDCLVQVNISDEVAKGGFEPNEVEDAIGALSKTEGIRIEGLMGMAELVDDAEAVRSQFVLLRTIRDHIRGLQIRGVDMRHLSMGMSNDFEVAVEEGATMVRIGSAIFGERPDTA